MNAFIEHHQQAIRFDYSCFDRILLNGVIQDHVLPRSQGGTSSWTNCVAACIRCNARKADRTPEQAGMKLRRRPVRPEWKPFYAAQGARVESWSRFLPREPALVLA